MLPHYRLAERLGESGMGVVYKPLDTRLKRPVKIKILPRRAKALRARSVEMAPK